MPATIEAQKQSCWTDEFWIRHCEGFRVERPGGPIGIVEGVRHGPDGEVEALLVRHEGLVRVVPTSDVRAVDGWLEVVFV
jgi:hypothetical protein